MTKKRLHTLGVCTFSLMVKNPFEKCLYNKPSKKILQILRMCNVFFDGKKLLEFCFLYRSSKKMLHTLSVKFYLEYWLTWRDPRKWSRTLKSSIKAYYKFSNYILKAFFQCTVFQLLTRWKKVNAFRRYWYHISFTLTGKTFMYSSCEDVS